MKPSSRPHFDAERGLLSRRTFSDPELFESELDHIFRRAWLFVGHESQIPSANDFFCSRMGVDRVIVTRDKQAKLHVLLNTCRHRGMRLVRYDEGNTNLFTCPYHAWTYSTDGAIVRVPGQLVGVQAYQQAYQKELDKVEWGLIQARVETYKGAIFASWDQDAPPLHDYLGGFRFYLDALLDPQDGGDGRTEVVGGVLKWRLNSNWKPCAENFIGDFLHAPSHRSVELVGIGPGGAGKSRHGLVAGMDLPPLVMTSFPNLGHGVMGPEPYTVTPDRTDIFPNFESPVGPRDVPPVVEEYYREVAERRRQTMVGRTAVSHNVMVGGIFPNMSLHPAPYPRTIAVWHPISPGVTEAWRWLIVDADAPQEVKDLNRHHFMRYSGPAGMTEQDDMENWSYLTESAQGNIVQDYDFNYQAGLHTARPSEFLPGAMVSDVLYTELTLRGFYEAWTRHMSTESWAQYLARVGTSASA
jgi:phenylpropionate dioxygenase-like ring-hydroxylating dioxygenase large terminal subunit